MVLHRGTVERDANLSTSSSCVILVTAFLWSFLSDLRHFAEECVGEICREMHVMLGIGFSNADYDLGEWMERGWISFKDGQNAHSTNSRTVLGFWGTRQARDATWLGDQTQPHMIHEVTTRVTHRLYIFLEDLSGDISVPADKTLRSQAATLRLQRHPFLPQGSSSVVLRQLRVLKMFRHLQGLRDIFPQRWNHGLPFRSRPYSMKGSMQPFRSPPRILMDSVEVCVRSSSVIFIP